MFVYLNGGSTPPTSTKLNRMIKTKVTKTISNEYRVIWTNLTKWQGGYEDFPTEYQAMRFINRLKYES
jgi:hypothetical protein